MSSERRTHHTLVTETGRFKISADQEDTIRKIMGGMDFELQQAAEERAAAEERCTLNLPILKTGEK